MSNLIVLKEYLNLQIYKYVQIASASIKTDILDSSNCHNDQHLLPVHCFKNLTISHFPEPNLQSSTFIVLN